MTDSLDEISSFDETKFNSQISDFDNLLKDIESLDDKKRRLWIEIYGNAITDRRLAHSMLLQLMSIVENKSNEHSVHGRTIASFIERMSKSNEQLIKLAELVEKAKAKDEEIDIEDIYKRIS